MLKKTGYFLYYTDSSFDFKTFFWSLWVVSLFDFKNIFNAENN